MEKTSIESTPKNKSELPTENGLDKKDIKKLQELKNRFNAIIDHSSSGVNGLYQVLNNPALDSVTREILDLIKKGKKEEN